MELAQSISVQFQQDVDNDGIFGLGFSNINTVTPTQQKTFFDNVKGTLALPLFTANLLKGTPGSYDFGFIDSSKHTGNVTYVSVDSANGFWGVISKGFAVGSGNFTFSPFRSIVDTGTTLLLLPVALVSAYYASVSGARYDSYQGGYTFPCSTFLPSFTLGFEEYRAVVPGSYINYAPLEDGTDGECLIPLQFGGHMLIELIPACYGGIQRNTGIGFSIIGDVFIKSQFIVFDSRGPHLGIAPKALFNIDY